MRRAAVILNYNDSNNVIKLTDLLSSFSYFDMIVIVDNNSNEDERKIMLDYKKDKVEVLETGKNLYFSGGTNFGLHYLEDKNIDLVCLFNSDIDIKKEVIEKCEEALISHDELAVTSCKMNEYGVIKQCTYAFPTISHYIADNLGFIKLFKIRPKPRKVEGNLEYYDYIRSSFWIAKYKDLKAIDFFDENTKQCHVETCIGLKLDRLNRKFAILNDIQYDHNHIYTKGYKMRGYRDTYRSLLYIYKEYQHRNAFTVFFYKMSYYIGYAIRKICRIS